jgi:fumarate reductase flavoprotein subunit
MSAKVCDASQLQVTEHVPVVIVGGGACGLTAALALHRLGVECVVLERDATPSGSTALSSGFVPAPCTHTQKAKGVIDSPDLFAKDIQAKAKGTAAEHLVQAYSQAIGPALDALADAHGITWELLDNFLYPGHSVHRMHAVPERTGAALMQHLQVACDNAGVMLLTQAKVTELWADAHHKLHGVGYTRPDGSIERLRCDAVVLACNGFGGNADLVKQLLPDMADAIYAGHVGNDGSAIQWAQQLGARTADLGGYQGHGSWAMPQGALITWALMMEGGVQINAHGQRFHDETQGYSEAAVQVLTQPHGTAWNVFDNPLLALAKTFPDFCDAQSAGAVKSFDDVAALANHIGCDVSALEHTLQNVTAGVCAQTGRVFQRALKAPFHAVRVTGALFHTQGGLDINAQCQVLGNHDQQPLPNLLAAGGAARGVSGNAVWGYLSGNGLLSAIAGGHIAAHTAAQLVASNIKSSHHSA